MEDALLSAFLSGLDRTSSPRGDADELLRHLHECQREGAGRWPRLDLDGATFAASIGRSVSRQEDDALHAMQRLHVADLYLACACVHRRPGAHRAFDAAHLLVIDGVPALCRADAATVDVVRRRVRRQLFVRSSAKLASFSGFGSLTTWVAMIVQGTAVDLLHRSAAPVDAEMVRVVDAILPAGGDPEIDYLKSRYRAELQHAFRVGLCRLSRRDRLVFRLNVAEGFSLERIGNMYGVDPTTVSSWLQTARHIVKEEIGRMVADRFPLPSEELISLIRFLPTDLDFSVTQTLGSDEWVALA